MLCFPMSVRKEVYEEPRGHRQPGWPGVVRNGGGRDGWVKCNDKPNLALRQAAFYIDS